jgi:hypothetical protein
MGSTPLFATLMLFAVDDIVREIAFTLNLMKEFGIKLKEPLVILEDNQSTTSLCTTKSKICVQSILMFGIFIFGILYELGWFR